MLILVTGGVRSGKSSFAESLATRYFKKGRYIATAIAFDGEMTDRIDHHRRQREHSGFPWVTNEEPYELIRAIQSNEIDHHEVILIDCLTIWLSNWLLLHDQQGDVRLVEQQIDQFVEQIAKMRDERHVILVTNEVGAGIVPEHRLGRLFRDYAGQLNQQMAKLSDYAILVTAGIPINLHQLVFRDDLALNTRDVE